MSMLIYCYTFTVLFSFIFKLTYKPLNSVYTALRVSILVLYNLHITPVWLYIVYVFIMRLGG